MKFREWEVDESGSLLCAIGGFRTDDVEASGCTARALVIYVELCSRSRKEKLNTEQYQSSQDNISLPGPAHSNVSETTGLHYQLLGTPSLSSCHPKSRDRHNCSDSQLQPKQILANESVPQDSGIRCLAGCAPNAGRQHNLSSMPEYHLESDNIIDARNISLTGQDIHSHQNFSLTSESLPSYRGNQESRDGEESSEFLHTKSQGATAPVVNKRKSPKASLSSVPESQQNCTPACDSSDHKPQQ
jgi:hypothetical protein